MNWMMFHYVVIQRVPAESILKTELADLSLVQWISLLLE